MVALLQPTKVKVTREKIDIKDKVFFETGKTTIKSESFGLLDEVAQILIDHPELLKIRIEGHTDSRGSESTNQRLSEGRPALTTGADRKTPAWGHFNTENDQFTKAGSGRT